MFNKPSLVKRSLHSPEIHACTNALVAGNWEEACPFLKKPETDKHAIRALLKSKDIQNKDTLLYCAVDEGEIEIATLLTEDHGTFVSTIDTPNHTDHRDINGDGINDIIITPGPTP